MDFQKKLEKKLQQKRSWQDLKKNRLSVRNYFTREEFIVKDEKFRFVWYIPFDTTDKLTLFKPWGGQIMPSNYCQPPPPSPA